MQKLFDTHAHLMEEAFIDDYDAFLGRTLSGCGGVINVGCSPQDAQTAVNTAIAHPTLLAAVGLHPQDAHLYDASHLEAIRTLAQDPCVRAIGETGLDYHWKDAPPAKQKWLFAAQIELARQLNKPLIIHDREAHRDCLDVLWANGAEAVGGVMHAYSGSVEMMQEVIAHHFYIGLGGVVTFKNAKTAKRVAQEVPLDRLLLETDCPYMTPVPFRGKRNEPAYTRYVAAAIAELRGVSYEEILEATWQNACRLFRLDPETLAPLPL